MKPSKNPYCHSRPDRESRVSPQEDDYGRYLEIHVRGVHPWIPSASWRIREDDKISEKNIKKITTGSLSEKIKPATNRSQAW